MKRAHSSSGSARVLRAVSLSRREAIYSAILLFVAAFFVLRLSQYSRRQIPARLISLTTTQTLLRGGGRVGREDEPTSLVTQLVINSDAEALPQQVVPGGTTLRGGATRDASSSTADDSDPSQSRGIIGGNTAAGGGSRAGSAAASSGRVSRYIISTETLTESQRQAAQAYEARQRAALQRALPAEFDWQTYLLYHPDLRASGVSTEAQAKQHYIKQGRAEGRVYKRLRVIVRYTACTGLINQQYSHIAAFTLAAVLGAEIVLPPAAKRDSFAHYFSVFKEQNEVSWTAAPLESLMDVDSIVDGWRSKGMTVHKTPGLAPFPDLTQPEVAYPLYAQPGIDARFVSRMEPDAKNTVMLPSLGPAEGVYLKNLDMPELIEKARSAVIGHASKLLLLDHGLDVSYIVLELPCTFFMLRSLSNLRVVTEVTRSLEFSPLMHSMADRVVTAIAARSPEYNAVHLRIEKDARDWSQIMGGPEAVWNAYVLSMRQAGFTAAVPMYAASGLLTYGASEDMDHIIATLQAAGLCSEVLYKELYIPQAELDALNSEQKALLDFLVLAKGKLFVGFGSSTFSFYLREHRVLNGSPRSSSVLVDASVIGTDPLFNSAGTVV